MEVNVRNCFLIKHYGYALLLLGCLASLMYACKDEADAIAPEYTITASETGVREDVVDELAVAADGGRDTLYVFASTEITVYVNESVDWLNVVEQKYDQGRKATMVVVEAEAMVDDLTQRVGELDMISGEKYGRRFFKVTQGYEAHFSDDFSWLHYGQGNPLLLDEGVLIADWNPAQQAYGWLSDTLPGFDKAFVYGKAGYVQLGSDLAGAALSTPILSGVQNDSLMALTFNAVGFVASDGTADQNDLTVLLSGGTFEDGTTEKVVQLGVIDPESALVATHMWENAAYRFTVKKPLDDPYSTTIQVTFLSGAGTAVAHNRVFLDDVRLFFKAPYEAVPEENTQ